MTASMVKACQIIVRSMSLNELYSECALVTRIKFPFFPRPNLIFYKPYVTSRNCPLMHNTTAYTSHIQNRDTWVIVEYHNELWDNSKWSYTFVWSTAKKSKNFCPSLYTWYMLWVSSLAYFRSLSISFWMQYLSILECMMTRLIACIYLV